MSRKPHLALAAVVQRVEQLHQLLAVLARRGVIKQPELRHSLTVKITEHHATLVVPVTGDEHRIQRPDGGFDDIAAVLRWRRQRCCGLVSIVGFVGGERTGADKHRLSDDN